MARVAEQTNSYYGASTMPELSAWRDRIVLDLLKAKLNMGDRY
jgi:hypothetical protein